MKKKIFTVFQILVTFGIFFWVFHDPQKRAQMAMALRPGKEPPGVAGCRGFGFYGVVELLAAFRWYILLRVQGSSWLPGGSEPSSCWASSSIPSCRVDRRGRAEDLFLIKEIPKKKAAGLLAVLMDRLVGLHGPYRDRIHYYGAAIPLAQLDAGFAASDVGFAHDPRFQPCGHRLLVSSSAASSWLTSCRQRCRCETRSSICRSPITPMRVAWPVSLAGIGLTPSAFTFALSLFTSAPRGRWISDITAGALLTVMPIILTLASLPDQRRRNGSARGALCDVAGPALRNRAAGSIHALDDRLHGDCVLGTHRGVDLPGLPSEPDAQENAGYRTAGPGTGTRGGREARVIREFHPKLGRTDNRRRGRGCRICPRISGRWFDEAKLDEFRITWRPCVIGGAKAPPLTGLDETFLSAWHCP